jgi:hypothetical protein
LWASAIPNKMVHISVKAYRDAQLTSLMEAWLPDGCATTLGTRNRATLTRRRSRAGGTLSRAPRVRGSTATRTSTRGRESSGSRRAQRPDRRVTHRT